MITDPRWLVRAGAIGRLMAHDPRGLRRNAQPRQLQPSAAIFGNRALQSSPESGGMAGYDGRKRKNGSKVRLAVEPGELLGPYVTPANEQARPQAVQVRNVTGRSVGLACVDQG